MYIIIPKSEAETFKRTISKFESLEPVQLSDGTFCLPADVLDRLNELAALPEYQTMKATYVSTLKELLESFEQKADIKHLIIHEEII